VLVFAADLEEVEEVCGGGVDGDEVFGGFGSWGGEVEDFEVFGALGTCQYGRGRVSGRGVYLHIFLDFYALHSDVYEYED
jgi:hypothetical protein